MNFVVGPPIARVIRDKLDHFDCTKISSDVLEYAHFVLSEIKDGGEPMILYECRSCNEIHYVNSTSTSECLLHRYEEIDLNNPTKDDIDFIAILPTITNNIEFCSIIDTYSRLYDEYQQRRKKIISCIIIVAIVTAVVVYGLQ